MFLTLKFKFWCIQIWWKTQNLNVTVFCLLHLCKPAGVGSLEKLSRCPEDRGAGQNDKPPKSREEMREHVNTALPSTWRRSSLPTEESAAMEELWFQAAGDVPVNRVVQTGSGSWGGQTSLPVVKSRRESRRSSLNVGPLTSNNALIDVRKNPVWKSVDSFVLWALNDCVVYQFFCLYISFFMVYIVWCGNKHTSFYSKHFDLSLFPFMIGRYTNHVS